MSDDDHKQRTRSRTRASGTGDGGNDAGGSGERAPKGDGAKAGDGSSGGGGGQGSGGGRDAGGDGGGDGSPQGGQARKGRRRNKRRRGGRRRGGPKPQETEGVGFWGEVEQLPAPQHEVRMTEDPGAVPRSLGTPPLPGHEHIAQHYFELVYDRAVTTASALAAAGGLIEPDELTELVESDEDEA